MVRSSCDILIVGMGLGAVAIAKQLIPTGASMMMLPGAGRARFNHLDGGVVNPAILKAAIGDAQSAPLHQMGDFTVFHRDELESWAIAQITDSVSIVESFEEARTVPHDSGKITVLDASGEQALNANSVVLTEGANPKIGIANRLREDFAPEDMIHFGRTVVEGARLLRPMNGDWRTSWNMPAWYSAIPTPNGAIVSASVRIENVMRSGRDGRDTLRDLLASPFSEELGIFDSDGQIGMELVPLRARVSPVALGAHNVMISLDANGTIDARSPERFNAVLGTGMEMGAMMASEWPNLVEWDLFGLNSGNMFTTTRTPYHDDEETGFIEDGAEKRRGLLGRFLNRK